MSNNSDLNKTTEIVGIFKETNGKEVEIDGLYFNFIPTLSVNDPPSSNDTSSSNKN